MASPTTRDRIQVIIQSRHSETVAGLAAELGLAPATIRRHLDILQRDGYVTFTEIRRGTGRPEYSFSLTESGYESLPKQYDNMLDGLVSRLAGLGPDALDGRSGMDVLQKILADMARETVESHRAAGGGHDVSGLFQMLKEQDFAPEISEDENGLSISLMSCPFRSVAVANPALCNYDTAVIEKVSGLPVRRMECITRGDPCCTYLLVKSPESNA